MDSVRRRKLVGRLQHVVLLRRAEPVVVNLLVAGDRLMLLGRFRLGEAAVVEATRGSKIRPPLQPEQDRAGPLCEGHRPYRPNATAVMPPRRLSGVKRRFLYPRRKTFAPPRRVGWGQSCERSPFCHKPSLDPGKRRGAGRVQREVSHFLTVFGSESCLI